MKQYYIRVKTKEQLKAVMKWGKADYLIVDSLLENEITDGRDKVIFSLPDIAREEKLSSIEKIYEKCCKSGGLMIKNLDELGLLLEKGYEGKVIADPFLYAYNSEALEFYREYYPDMSFVCSDELTDREMRQTIDGLAEKTKSVEISDKFIYRLYGYQQLMITNQCVSRNYTSCTDKTMTLKDERGNCFIAQSNCGLCYSTVYNGCASSMMDKLEEISFDNLLVDFTVENSGETEEVLKKIDAFSNEKTSNEKERGISRGHHYKGVD